MDKYSDKDVWCNTYIKDLWVYDKFTMIHIGNKIKNRNNIAINIV
jgi:hypothetical protein